VFLFNLFCFLAAFVVRRPSGEAERSVPDSQMILQKSLNLHYLQFITSVKVTVCLDRR
jgi:hypothetical protein